MIFIHRAHRRRQLDNDQRRHYPEPGFRKEIIHSGVERNHLIEKNQGQKPAKKERTHQVLKATSCRQKLPEKKTKIASSVSVLNKMKVSASFFVAKCAASQRHVHLTLYLP